MKVTEEYIQNDIWILETDCMHIGTSEVKIFKCERRMNSNFRRVVTYGGKGEKWDKEEVQKSY